MEIHRGKLDVLDYLFFATVERGKVYETGAFIHNYALAYALRLAASSYTHKIQKPDYVRELAPLNEWGVYLTPARPLNLLYRLTQWNTIRETYGIGKKPQSIGYPDWGFARVLRPGSAFEFYLLVANPSYVRQIPAFENLLAGGTAYVRLGKFPAKARIRLTKPQKVAEKRGPFTAGVISERGRPAAEQRQSSLLLNWRDIPSDPVLCDVYSATLPTRLLANPKFNDGRYYIAEFGDDDSVILPAEMRFLARSI